MHFIKDKHSSGYVINVGGVIGRYRKTGEANGVDIYSAEFNDLVKFDLQSELEAQAWITFKYAQLLNDIENWMHE